MAYPFPYEVKKRKGPLDEEELKAYYHDGLKLITVVQTNADNDPQGPRYWYYFKVQGYVDIQNPVH